MTQNDSARSLDNRVAEYLTQMCLRVMERELFNPEITCHCNIRLLAWRPWKMILDSKMFYALRFLPAGNLSEWSLPRECVSKPMCSKWLKPLGQRTLVWLLPGFWLMFRWAHCITSVCIMVVLPPPASLYSRFFMAQDYISSWGYSWIFLYSPMEYDGVGNLNSLYGISLYWVTSLIYMQCILF